MDFDELMGDFAREAGMGEIEPEKDGFYSIAADDMPISVGQLPDGGLALWAEAGETPAEGREAFYRMLLEAVHDGRETAGALFSIDRVTGRVFLHAEDSSAPDTLDGLRDRLDAFASTLGDWRRRISDFRAPCEDLASGPSEGPILFGQEGFIRI